MITEQELFNLGWRRFDDHRHDPHYDIQLFPKTFGLTRLSGRLKSNGTFDIFGIQDRNFKTIIEIEELFQVNCFKIDWDLVNRYGTNISLNK